MLVGAVIASALPYLIKLLIRRRRPDRAVVHRKRHVIPISANPWGSFPSLHALYLGALARDLHALSPPGATIRSIRGVTHPFEGARFRFSRSTLGLEETNG